MSVLVGFCMYTTGIYVLLLLHLLLCEADLIMPHFTLVYVHCFCCMYCLYRDDSIWNKWLIPAEQQCPALLSLLHCEVSQAGWRSLQGPNAYPWTGHTA